MQTQTTSKPTPKNTPIVKTRESDTSMTVRSSSSQDRSIGQSRPSPSAHIPFRPTPEDKALLHYCLQMKYMSFDQIDRKFLGNQTSAVSFRSLMAGGYLKCKDTATTPNSLIVPTEKAYELLKLENPDKDIARPLKRVFEPAVKHDLKLVELRFRFEQLNFIKKWYSEKSLAEVPMMNRTFQNLPDGLCKKNNDKSYFLELEISPKTKKQYEERIQEYARVLEIQDIKEYGIEGVIFLCTDEKVCEIIKSKLPNSKNFSCLMLTRYLKPEEQVA